MKQNSGKRNEEEIKENKKQGKKFKKGRKARKNYLKNTNLFIYWFYVSFFGQNWLKQEGTVYSEILLIDNFVMKYICKKTSINIT